MGERRILGIDIGGTNIKHAVVELGTGELLTERHRCDTPKPATPEALCAAVCEAIDQAGEVEAVGVAFPAVVQGGIALTAVNIAAEWQYLDVAETFRRETGREVFVLNDGDAAGLAEVRFGAGRGVAGKVLLVTLGTGVGTSLFVDGRLVPNMEFARLHVRGKVAGERAANSVRKRKRLSWRRWAMDVEEFLRELDLAAWPELIVIGGGVSKEAHKFLPHIHCRPQVVPARFRNDAGILGAALYAGDMVGRGI